MTLTLRMTGFALAFVAGLFASAAPALSQDALRGVALVIGNGDYAHLPDLPNPPNDADAIEELLADLGFDSVRRADRDAATLSRDLERFAEDAEDADVAILYYSGHGIEAGGENYLVPVDADLSSLDQAADRLVPLSALIAKLQASVPVTIVMLDACRDNPFPPGATLKAGGATLPVTAGGLGATRGATSLGSTSVTAEETYGTVLSFAAEPGKVALDGDPGGNSPYAAAVLRHMEAMAGEEFGTVMRMVAEEVYLKTGGRQRPWVNESLRRLLYFGSAPEPVAGAEGDILAERRKLLLTIAALPAPDRARVEKVAADNGVPMDTLYGMLDALGQEAPQDPAELDRLLREQTAKIAELFGRQQTLSQSDPELARLAALTDEALREGAIGTAAKLRLEVDARIAELDKVVGAAEDAVKARRLEFAAEYARSAQVAIAGFDRLAAANYYAKAFEQAERWDDDFAMRVKNSEVEELRQHALMTGDIAALERGIAAGREAIGLGERGGGPDAAAAERVNLALLIAQHEDVKPNPAALAEAIDLVRAALPVHTRADKPTLWVVTYHALAHMLQTRGLKPGGDPADLVEAESIYRELVDAPEMKANRSLWSKMHGNLATTLTGRWRDSGDRSLISAAYDFVAAGIAGTDRAALPVDWAYLQMVAGDVSIDALKAGAGTDAAANAIAGYKAALSVFVQQHYPALWAEAMRKLAHATFTFGSLGADVPAMEQAVALQREIVASIPRYTKGVEWAAAEGKAGAMLYTLYELTGDPRHVRAAHAAYAAAYDVPGQPADQKLTVAGTLADAMVALAFVENDVTGAERAVTLIRNALAEAPATLAAADRMLAQSKLAAALYHIGAYRSDVAMLNDAAMLYAGLDRDAVRSRSPQAWTSSRSMFANVHLALGRIGKSAKSYEQAAAVFAELLPDLSRVSAPADWAELHRLIGGALGEAGYLSGSAALLERAAAAYREAMSAAPDPAKQIEAGEKLAQVTIDLGVMGKDAARVGEGRSMLAQLADRHRSDGNAARADEIAAMLAKVDQWLEAAR